MLAAPLIVNLDVRNMNEATKEILFNKDMIAIDQDPSGRQGFKFLDQGDFEVWTKELAGEEIAVCFLNRSNETIHKKVDLQSVIHRFGFQANSYKVFNVWENTNNSDILNQVKIGPHGVVVYRLVIK